MNTDEWLKSGKYLPKFMRDFHDQKDLFKTIDRRIKPDQTALIKRPSWMECQVYVIDTFLWFMARRGYTLQRTRQKCEFRDIEDDIKETIAEMDKQHYALFAPKQ